MKTIIALSTANACGAIGIIRLSGDDSLKLVKDVFSGFSKEVKPRYMYYGKLETSKTIDDCMCVYFKAPNSYTGEDMVEINCHGSPALIKSIIEYFLEKGAVLAQKGEFTQRAFINGKLDLTQAEGVIDLINSQTQAQSRSAYEQLSGKLYDRINEIQRKIITAIAKIEVSLDYPEEEIEETASNMAEEEINLIKAELLTLANSYETGRIIRDGVKVAIVGKPNVGKSKILNALLGYDRAIVTDIAGTTRDTLSESYEYKGMKFVVTDTAGIRETEDVVEKIGVDMAKTQSKSCDVLLLVTVAGEDFEKIDTTAKVVLVENKIDKFEPKNKDSVKVSALKNEGIECLKEEIYKSATSNITIGECAINNVRHLSAVRESLRYIDESLSAINITTLDLVAGELNNAYRALGKITGVVSSDEIVGEIFSKFCVGK